MKITFLGANHEVTGSSTLLEFDDTKVIIDIGILQSNQGAKEFQRAYEFNKKKLPYDPKEIDAVAITHAHIDHVGRLPLLLRENPHVKVIATEPTARLSTLNIKDGAYIMNKECDRMNRRLRKNLYTPAYTEEEVKEIGNYFQCYDYHQPIVVKETEKETVTIELIPCGHMIGASSIKVTHATEFFTKTFFFTGDTSGQGNRIPFTKPCPKLDHVDYLISESTYGDRTHEKIDFKKELCKAIKHAVYQSGVILMPVFAIHKSSTVLQMLKEVFDENPEIAHLPVYLDSPMAISSHNIIAKARKFWHKTWLKRSDKNNIWDWSNLEYLHDFKKTAGLNYSKPMVIVSCSGMLSGGRALFSLEKILPKKKHAVIFTGFAPEGTLARTLLEKQQSSISINGKQTRIRSKIHHIPFSGHADYNELTEWYKTCPSKKFKHVFLIHGAKKSAEYFKKHLQRHLNNTPIHIPEYEESIKLY